MIFTPWGEIYHALLLSPIHEKSYLITGPEFGPLEGKCYIFTREIYGFKSDGEIFRVYVVSKSD